MRTKGGQSQGVKEDGMIGAPRKCLIFLVPEEGLEPSQGYPYRILSPARLPFHHSGTGATINSQGLVGIQERLQIRTGVGGSSEKEFPALL